MTDKIRLGSTRYKSKHILGNGKDPLWCDGLQVTGLPMSLSCLSETSLLIHSSSAFSLSMNNCMRAQKEHVSKQTDKGKDEDMDYK